MSMWSTLTAPGLSISGASPTVSSARFEARCPNSGARSLKPGRRHRADARRIFFGNATTSDAIAGWPMLVDRDGDGCAEIVVAESGQR
jgi:hypothetical protein